ncbi:hypothetical protein TGARI_358240 [Toxoplasma gondii ARI]|uniref:Uncharacterized protein n=3 Tax=Toxoplasma gondii TaxID=5811 RepID=A0A2G8YE30_TOXGO|nr:hypothetical protein TGVAND_358240 [Toxoplasma gondii VAND]KYF40740.1 hypothetical protein TGARI_358240 [Toxoplasma gondii ARI]PIM05518.1 hypothetical protein TGCOUG_358240 [Toxoplasma gondii COUG]
MQSTFRAHIISTFRRDSSEDIWAVALDGGERKSYNAARISNPTYGFYVGEHAFRKLEGLTHHLTCEKRERMTSKNALCVTRRRFVDEFHWNSKPVLEWFCHFSPIHFPRDSCEETTRGAHLVAPLLASSSKYISWKRHRESG